MAITTLASIAENPKEPTSARVAAAGLLLERAWGRAPQSVHLSGEIDVRLMHLEAVRALSLRPEPLDIEALLATEDTTADTGMQGEGLKGSE